MTTGDLPTPTTRRWAPAGGWTVDTVALAVGYGASLVIVVATFTRSFAATAEYAVRVGAAHGGLDAWLVPIGIDVGIVAGSILAWASSRRGQRNWWAYGLFVFSAITSVVLNIAHAPLLPDPPGGLDPVEQAVWLEQAAAAAADRAVPAKFIAALPPLLLLWITEVLLRHVTPTAAPSTGASADVVSGGVSGGPDTAADGADGADTEDRVAALVSGHLAGGGHATDAELTAAVARALGVTERTARRRLQPYRTTPVGPPAGAALSVVSGNGHGAPEGDRTAGPARPHLNGSHEHEQGER